VNALTSFREDRSFLDDSCAQMPDEMARYAPYVEASNRTLDLMKTHHETFERKLKLRPPSSLDLRFHRNDPKVLQTKYPGTEEPVKRKPDVITTSKVAADDHGNPNSPAYHNFPPESFQWPDVLSCHEFKLKAKVLDTDKDKLLDKYNIERQAYYPADEPLITIPVELDPEDSTTENDNGAARKRTLEAPDAGPSDPTSKKPKVEQRSAGGKKNEGSGSRSQTRAPSNSQPAMPNDKAIVEVMKNPQKQKISPRAQCAMYAMEMLSHTFGTHHAITVLIHGEQWISMRNGTLLTRAI